MEVFYISQGHIWYDLQSIRNCTKPSAWTSKITLRSIKITFDDFNDLIKGEFIQSTKMGQRLNSIQPLLKKKVIFWSLDPLRGVYTW